MIDVSRVLVNFAATFERYAGDCRDAIGRLEEQIGGTRIGPGGEVPLKADIARLEAEERDWLDQAAYIRANDLIMYSNQAKWHELMEKHPGEYQAILRSQRVTFDKVTHPSSR